MNNYYITFGQHTHRVNGVTLDHDTVYVIPAETHEAARAIAMELFKGVFATSYDEAHFEPSTFQEDWCIMRDIIDELNRFEIEMYGDEPIKITELQGTCKNCKFSTPRSHDERLECRHWKVCNVDGHEPDGIDEWEAAEVSVGPEFGCIHFLDKHK